MLLAVGGVGSLALRSVLLDRARSDLDAEFLRRSEVALAGLQAEHAQYEELLEVIATFAGSVDDLDPAVWERFVTGTGIFEVSESMPVGLIDIVPAAAPEALPGQDDRYPLTRMTTGRPGQELLAPVDVGPLPEVRLALERLRTTAAPVTFAWEGAVADGQPDLERVIAAWRAAGGPGVLLPVQRVEDGPVVGAVVAGTLPGEAVARIAAATGDDLVLALAVEDGSGVLQAVHGEPSSVDTTHRSEVEGIVGQVRWVAEVWATPAFTARLDPSAANIGSAVLLALVCCASASIVVRSALRRRAGAALEQLAAAERRAGWDGLTGVRNRAGLEAALDAWAAEGRDAEPATVVYVDLDGLKEVNDGAGHDAGDALIREAAHRLRRITRRGDLVARLGGDEFVVVALGLDGPPADRLAASVLAAYADPVFGGDGPVAERIDASIGLARAASLLEVPDAIARADAAMYRAKTAGGNRVGFAGSDPAVDVVPGARA